MNKQEQEFVSSGFEFYPQAVDAIDAFVRLLGDEFIQAVSRLSALPGLRIEACSKPTWGTGNGCWVCADVVVVKGQTEFSLEFGWWWNAPGVPVPLVAYCAPVIGSRRLRLDGHQSAQVEVSKIDGKWTLVATNIETREKAIAALLSEGLRVILADASASGAET